MIDIFFIFLRKLAVTIFVEIIFWLFTLYSFQEYVVIETMSTSDQYSIWNMPFLNNEFLKIEI